MVEFIKQYKALNAECKELKDYNAIFHYNLYEFFLNIKKDESMEDFFYSQGSNLDKKGTLECAREEIMINNEYLAEINKKVTLDLIEKLNKQYIDICTYTQNSTQSEINRTDEIYNQYRSERLAEYSKNPTPESFDAYQFFTDLNRTKSIELYKQKCKEILNLAESHLYKAYAFRGNIIPSLISRNKGIISRIDEALKGYYYSEYFDSFKLYEICKVIIKYSLVTSKHPNEIFDFLTRNHPHEIQVTRHNSQRMALVVKYISSMIESEEVKQRWIEEILLALNINTNTYKYIKDKEIPNQDDVNWKNEIQKILNTNEN